MQDPDLKVKWGDVDDLVHEVAETGHSQAKVLGPSPNDEEWLPPDLKLELTCDRVEINDGEDGDGAQSVPSQNLKKRSGKTGNKISKLSRGTYPISCPRCALVSLTHSVTHLSKGYGRNILSTFCQPFRSFHIQGLRNT